MTCQVIRPFDGPGGKRLEAGAVVDASGWRWAQQLVQQGYLRVIAAEPPAPEREKASRR